MSERFALNLLGGFAFQGADGTAVQLPLKRAKALLAYLATETRRQHSRDELAALLWGDARQDQARHNLRQVLSSLRKALPRSGPDILRTDGELVSLDRSSIDLDVLAFERLAAAEDADSKNQAISLYRGGFLAGFELETPTFNEWTHHHRERLKESAIACLLQLLAARTAAERFDDAILLAQKVLALDPLREDAHQFLIRTYASQGKKALALRQYKLCAEALERELGVSPDDATQQLYASVSRSNGAKSPMGRASVVDVRAEGASKAVRDTTDATSALRPLFGRHRELATVKPMLERFATRRGGIIALVGEAGIGKSRMAAEILGRSGKDKVVWIAHGRPGERIFADGLWSDILEDEAFADATAGKNGDLSDEAIYGAVRAIAQRNAERKPMLLVIEDLQWADEASLRSLIYLSNRIAPLPLLLVVTVRAEDLYRHPGVRSYLDWLRLQDFAVAMDLPPLSPAETTALIDHELSTERGTVPITVPGDEIRRIGEGNPMAVIELLRAARSRTPGGARRPLAVPDRLARMIAARLEQLDFPARSALDAAAVIGRQFPFGLWRKAAQLEGAEGIAVLESLVTRRFLEIKGNDVRFIHERVRHFIYASLLPQRRSFLHRLAAQALQSLHHSKPGPHYGALAQHWREAQDLAAAALCELGAAAFSTRCGRWDDARDHAERALALTAQSDASPSTTRMRIEAELCLSDLAQVRRSFVESAARLESLGPLARALGDPLLEGRLLVAEARCHHAAGRLAAAYESARRGLRLLEGGGESPWVAGDQILVRMHMVARGPDTRLERLVASLRSARDDGRRLDEATELGALGICRALRGDFVQAEADCRRSVAIAERFGDGRCLALCLQHRAQVLVWRGNAESALGDLNRAIASADSSGDLFRLYLLRGYRGLAHHVSGKPRAAMDDLREALEAADRLMTRFHLALFTGYLAEACLAAGAEDEALRHGRRALRLAAEHNQPWSRSIALRAVGAILLSSDPPDLDGAGRALRTALTIQEGLELESEAAVTLRLYSAVKQTRAGAGRAVPPRRAVTMLFDDP